MRVYGVVLGSLIANVAFAEPPQAPRPPGAPRVEAYEVRRVVEVGGPRLGVEAIELTPELQEHFGSEGLGVLVSRVFDGSAADCANAAAQQLSKAHSETSAERIRLPIRLMPAASTIRRITSSLSTGLSTSTT